VEQVELLLHGRESKGDPVPLYIDTCRATFLGAPIQLRQYAQSWGDETASNDARRFRSERVPEGQYQRIAESKREFAPRDLVADDIDIERAELVVRYPVRVARPALISSFEVKSRGRAVSFAPVQFHGDVTTQTRLICPIVGDRSFSRLAKGRLG
jgi:hypothetical protein